MQAAQITPIGQLTFKGTRPTVLVVEDEGLIRMPIADCLRDNWRVLEAASGEEAKALFDAGKSIDVVFSDVQMSPSCNGFVLAEWIHANHPQVHMLLTSGHVSMTHIPADVCARDSMFKKPYHNKAVVARIEALLAGAN